MAKWTGRMGRVSRGDLSPMVNAILDDVSDSATIGDIDTDTAESKTIVGLLKNITELVESGTDLTEVNTLLSAIKTSVDDIPTTDNTSTISAIKTTVDSIPKTDNTSSIVAINTTVDEIRTTVNSIPKTDTSSTISTINTTVNNINSSIAAGVMKEYNLTLNITDVSTNTTANLPLAVRKGLYSMRVNSCPESTIAGHIGYLQYVDIAGSDSAIRILKTASAGSNILMYRAQDDAIHTNFGTGTYDLTFYYIP